jgi:hypothetical protein
VLPDFNVLRLKNRELLTRLPISEEQNTQHYCGSLPDCTISFSENQSRIEGYYQPKVKLLNIHEQANATAKGQNCQKTKQVEFQPLLWLCVLLAIGVLSQSGSFMCQPYSPSKMTTAAATPAS